MNEYYNIDFEKNINLDQLKDFMINKFPEHNISINYNQELYEIIHDKNSNKFKIWVSLNDLKTGEIDDFLDVKIRSIWYISIECKLDANKIIKLLHEMTTIIQSKIYISMEDIEQNKSSFSYYSVWCLDGDTMKIMFDAQEFFDDCKSQYTEYLPITHKLL